MAQVATITGFDLEALRDAGHRVHATTEEGGPVFAELRQTIDRLERDAADKQNAAGGLVTAPVTRRRPRRQAERSNDMNTTTAMPATPNSPTFSDILAVAKTLGEDAGKGKDTQIKFALKVIEAAYLGVLDLDPNKHGTDMRDGKVLAEAYVKAQQGVVIFDAKADTARKLISNLDKCIKLGGNPKFGQGQPLQNVNDLMTFRQQEKRANKKVDDAFNTLMRYATAQLKAQTLIVDDALKSFVYKREPNLRHAEDVLESVCKTLNQLKAGKIAHCADIDTSEEVTKAIKSLRMRLTNIAKAKSSTLIPAVATKAA